MKTLKEEVVSCDWKFFTCLFFDGMCSHCRPLERTPHLSDVDLLLHLTAAAAASFPPAVPLLNSNRFEHIKSVNLMYSLILRVKVLNFIYHVKFQQPNAALIV